jgi:hypothetical protein
LSAIDVGEKNLRIIVKYPRLYANIILAKLVVASIIANNKPILIITISKLESHR